MSLTLHAGLFRVLGTALLLSWMPPAFAQAPADAVPYLQLSKPQRILETAQRWEGNEQPHTLSVVELNRDGFQYWGYYGLNEGRGIGLAFSNDLVHWTKYKNNPLWLNARWTSVIEKADPKHPDRLFYAITRDYDALKSHIMLASSDDGIHLKQIKDLVKVKAGSRPFNQNPNLFRDPISKKFVLTFYGGNGKDSFDILSKSADRIEDLDKAPEKRLLHDSAVLAAPTMLYLKQAPDGSKGIYYLVTEICPQIGPTPDDVEWQVKVFQSHQLNGPFVPVSNNPVQVGDRACLFQHVFNGRYYGFQSHRLALKPIDKWEMEMIEAPIP